MMATNLQHRCPARHALSLLAALFVLAVTLAARASEPLDLFDSETQARSHCGRSSVVWLEVPAKTYWLKGQRGYGGSRSGGYTCLKDAKSTGNHPNGGKAGAKTRARHHHGTAPINRRRETTPLNAASSAPSCAKPGNIYPQLWRIEAGA
jgi:hypothetical protein